MVVIVMVAAGVLYAMVRSYLHSDAFRQFLSERVGRAARVSGEFTPFRWDGLAVDTSAFNATGEGVVRELRVEGLHTEVGVNGLRRGVWEIQGSRAQRVEVSVDARKQSGGSNAPAGGPQLEERASDYRREKKGWLPNRIELQGMDVGELIVRAILKQGPASVTGMNVRVEPAGGHQAYLGTLTGGDIVLPFDLVPTIRLDRARLRYQDGRVFLNSANASVWKDGRMSATGEWDSTLGRYAIGGGISGVKCDEVFNETWAKRVTGNVDSDFMIANSGGPPVASGHLTVNNGTLTAMPVLDALAAYADTRRFRLLSLSEAHTDWRWRDGELQLSNLVIASEGLVRLEGNISIRGKDLDGVFLLGLTPGTLARIPGAETDVFSPGARGLLWTTLRITGTTDDPEEDLTARLIEAAGIRMFEALPETGEKVIKYSRALLGDSPSKVIDKGVEIIEKNAGLVEDVSGLLDGILGGGKRKEDKKRQEEP